MVTPARRMVSRFGSDWMLKLRGFAGVGRFALEPDEAPERQRVEGDRRAPQVAERRHAGREADAEFVDGHSRPSRHDEMAELVDDDEDHEHDEHQRDVDQTIQGDLPARRGRSAR